jgi:anti-anti-sigma factor
MTGALNITDSHSGNVCVVALSGRIDSSNANDLMSHLTKLIGAGEKSILVDFAQVLYLTSAAFRALLVATDEAERATMPFAFCNLVGHVRELFEMGGLLEVFTILPSREEALKQLG